MDLDEDSAYSSAPVPVDFDITFPQISFTGTLIAGDRTDVIYVAGLGKTENGADGISL